MAHIDICGTKIHISVCTTEMHISMAHIDMPHKNTQFGGAYCYMRHRNGAYFCGAYQYAAHNLFFGFINSKIFNFLI
jgi:hypothetical protein